MNPLVSREYDPAIGKFTYTANTYYRMRQEGWATTFIGKHNTIGVKDIERNELPKIAVWGDSDVVAFSVPDASKMSQLVSEIYSQKGRKVLGFSIAHSQNSLADYIVDLRKYELLIPDIVSHYIVLSDLKDDTLPNRNTDTERSKFLYNYGFRIVESECRPPHQQVYYQLSKYNLRMVSYFFGKVSGYQVQLPWSRREAANTDKQTEEPLYDKIEAWEFILGELRKQSSKPITFLYCPYRPEIRRGRVSFEDPEKDKMIFAGICKRYNITFIDLTERFNNFFLQTKKFPRGFANSFPGRGHLNAHGHRLVAEAIFSNELSSGSIN